MYDFFLSYATSDDTPAIHGVEESRWITVFFETLKNRVGFHLGRKAQPFLDRSELVGNVPLTNEITKALVDSRLFVAVSTPTYYQRSWCEKERLHFIGGLGGDPAAARRVFVVHQTGLDSADPYSWQRSFFPDVRGYHFHRERLQTEGGGCVTFGYPMVNEDNAAEYANAIDSLARDMAKRIGELEQSAPVAAVAPAGGNVSADSNGNPPTQSGEIVILAPCSIKVRAEFEELRRSLEDAGFRVATPTAGAQSFSDPPGMIVAFVQIVSPVLMEIPGDSSGATLDLHLWEAARALNLPSFRWRSPGIDIKTVSENHPGHEDFTTIGVREQLFATFKKDLIDELNLLRVKRRIANSGIGKVVLLAAEGGDLAGAAALVALLQRYGLGAWVTDKPYGEILADDIHAFLVYYGRAKPDSVREYLSIVRTLPPPRRKKLPVGIYFEEPPPAIASKHLLYSMPEFHHVQWDDDRAIQNFINSIFS